MKQYTQSGETELTEWRGRINKTQHERLKILEEKLHIPQSALVRLALSCFLPKLNNYNYTEEAIKNLWNSEKF